MPTIDRRLRDPRMGGDSFNRHRTRSTRAQQNKCRIRDAVLDAPLPCHAGLPRRYGNIAGPPCATLYVARYDTRSVVSRSSKSGGRAMLKAFRRVSVSSLAYASLLMAFVSLGAFVAALATGSHWAAISGVVLIACLAASVVGFRAAGRAIARFTAATEPASAVSIFSTPLQQEQVDRYLKNYRTGADPLAQAGHRKTVPAPGEKPRRMSSPLVGRRQQHSRPDGMSRRALNRER